MLCTHISCLFWARVWSVKLEHFSWRFPSSGGFRSKRRCWKVISLWSTMPPKMNQVWKALQEKMSNKRTQQAIRPRKGAKGTAAPSDIIVQRLTAEPDNKQTFRPVQPREFVEFSSDDLLLLRDSVVVGGSSPGPYRHSKWQWEIRNGKRRSSIAFLDFVKSLNRKRYLFCLVCVWFDLHASHASRAGSHIVCKALIHSRNMIMCFSWTCEN